MDCLLAGQHSSLGLSWGGVLPASQSQVLLLHGFIRVFSRMS